MRTWTANYDGNQIRIEHSGFFQYGKLFVNNKLQDEKSYVFEPPSLTGHLMSNDGDRKPVKAHLNGIFIKKCRLFIDDEIVEVTKVS